jgi:hypothetical protein
MPLPYAPPPNSDGLLSSWIERIGLFYGIGYLMLAPTRPANVWGENEDLDSSEDIRRLLPWLSATPSRKPIRLGTKWLGTHLANRLKLGLSRLPAPRSSDAPIRVRFRC